MLPDFKRKSVQRKNTFAKIAFGLVAILVSHDFFALANDPLPNVVFILADDFGYGDVQCNYRKGKTPTPNIDRLAKQGMRFTDAHTPSAVCTPTRYAILIGQFAWRTRLKSGALYDLSKDPAERENLYGVRPEIVRELTALLEKYKNDGRSITLRNVK